MDDELIMEVDDGDKRIGVLPREEFYNGKHIHRAAHLLLFNSRGDVLLQKRSSGKRWYPGLYTYSVSGTVADESYRDCMKREIQEEIGLSVPFRKALKYYYKDEYDNVFNEIFIARSDSKIIPDKGEMSRIKWVGLESLMKDIKFNPQRYTPPFVKGIMLFFEKYKDHNRLI